MTALRAVTTTRVGPHWALAASELPLRQVCVFPEFPGAGNDTGNCGKSDRKRNVRKSLRRIFGPTRLCTAGNLQGNTVPNWDHIPPTLSQCRGGQKIAKPGKGCL